mgnify:CR=1 FL=1
MASTSTSRQAHQQPIHHQEWKTNGWRITVSTGPIATEEEKDRLHRELEKSSAPPPEQTYLANALRIEHEPSGWVLSFCAKDALKQSLADGNEPVKVAMASKWQADRADALKGVRKIDYDWTYTTSYAGQWSNARNPDAVMAMRDSDKQLNVELLTDRTIPLVAYHEAPLFVSELDDAGASELSVKVRVTERYWFVLMRFYLRVDDTLVRLRDVRWLNEEGGSGVLSETRWHETSEAGVVAACGSDSEQAASLLMSMAPSMVVRYRMSTTTFSDRLLVE